MSKGLKVGYLEQEPDFNNVTTVEDFILSFGHQTQTLLREYELLSTQPTADTARLDELVEQLHKIDAWNFENTLKTSIGNLRFI